MEHNDNPFEFHESDLYIACVGENGGTDNFDIREGFKSSVEIMIKALIFSMVCGLLPKRQMYRNLSLIGVISH